METEYPTKEETTKMIATILGFVVGLVICIAVMPTAETVRMYAAISLVIIFTILYIGLFISRLKPLTYFAQGLLHGNMIVIAFLFIKQLMN